MPEPTKASLWQCTFAAGPEDLSLFAVERGDDEAWRLFTSTLVRSDFNVYAPGPKVGELPAPESNTPPPQNRTPASLEEWRQTTGLDKRSTWKAPAAV